MEIINKSLKQETINRKRVEEELWESKAIFEKIFEFAPDAIVVVNREGHIVRINIAAEKMFGHTRDELLGKTVEILIPERFRERHVKQRNKYFIKPHVRSLGLGLGLYGRRKDGSEFPADIMLSPLETAGGVLVLSVVRDITERKQAEEELRRAHDELEIRVQERTSELAKANEFLQDEIAERRRAEDALKNYAAALEEANRIKDLFTDIMHHDLLNPLSIIKTMSELQLEKTEEDGMQRSLLMIKRNTDKLIGMIKNASKYAKLESAEKLERSKLDLNMVFRAVADSLKQQIEEKSIKLEYLARDECYAMVNPIIEDVFSNLLDNAIKYSPQGSKIEANIIDENDSYKIYVKDWGFGIKDEDKAKLFTRFQRVDKKGVKGTGLGLAIVKRVVKLHGGEVWIEDNPEGGSVFFVNIPKT